MKHAIQSQTALAERTAIAFPRNYELLGPVRVLRKELGLTSNDVTVLTALLSFLPRDRETTEGRTPAKLTIVFPSNFSLSDRANGIDERTLRRCLARLEDAGLINRKNSANGKRFPLRYGGIIRDAFGIDLSPLIQGYDVLAAKASMRAEELERVRSLKAEALALRASLLNTKCVDETQLSSLGVVRNILRRATLTADAVLQIISELRELGANTPESYGEYQARSTQEANTQPSDNDTTCRDHCPHEMTGKNGHNDRQIESLKKELKKTVQLTHQGNNCQKNQKVSMNRDSANMAWHDFSHVASFFPEAPRTEKALSQILCTLGQFLRISQQNLMRGLEKAGAGKLLLILDYLLAKAEYIRQPEAYFNTILRTKTADFPLLDRGQD